MSGWRRWIRSGSHSPDSSFFDSGGRSYGRCGSAPTTTTSPANVALAERLRGPQPGERRPDDHDPLERHASGRRARSCVIRRRSSDMATTCHRHSPFAEVTVRKPWSSERPSWLTSRRDLLATTVQPPPTIDDVNRMIDELFPGSNNTCTDVGRRSPSRAVTSTDSETPSRRLRVRAEPVRARRRRPVVSRVRCHRSDRADGAHVGVVDPLPPPGTGLGAVGEGDARIGGSAQRRRHGPRLVRRPRPTSRPRPPRAPTPSRCDDAREPAPRFHLAMPVHDLAAARAFYGDVLGCPEGRSAPIVGRLRPLRPPVRRPPRPAPGRRRRARPAPQRGRR